MTLILTLLPTLRPTLRLLLKEIEQHCPCGARPESPLTCPHVLGCPVAKAIELCTRLDTVTT